MFYEDQGFHMEHRHIITEDSDVLTVAAVESILQRGRDGDIISLMRQLRSDPFSISADNALVAAEKANVYGYSKMVRACLNLWRQELVPSRYK